MSNQECPVCGDPSTVTLSSVHPFLHIVSEPKVEFTVVGHCGEDECTEEEVQRRVVSRNAAMGEGMLEWRASYLEKEDREAEISKMCQVCGKVEGTKILQGDCVLWEGASESGLEGA